MLPTICQRTIFRRVARSHIDGVGRQEDVQSRITSVVSCIPGLPPAQVRNGAPVRFGTRGAAASRRGTSAMPKAAAASTTCSSWLTTMRSTELMNCVELMCSFRNYNLN